MLELHTEIMIDAPVETVWGILWELETWSEWNPFITKVEGSATPDSRLRVTIQPPGGKAMVLAPTVLEVEPLHELRWRGRLLLPGIFTGEHSFVLDSNHDDGCHFVHSERFTGILVPFFKKMLTGPTKQGFEAMNQALKERAEARA
jgi:hypothetical protein